MGSPWCCGLCRSTALFKPFVMQTVLICASVHPRPVSALWSHPVLSPSYQRVPLFYMELVFSLYSLSLSLALPVTVWCLTEDKKAQVECEWEIAYSPVFSKQFLFCRLTQWVSWVSVFLSCDGVWRSCLLHFSFAKSFAKRNPLVLTSLWGCEHRPHFTNWCCGVNSLRVSVSSHFQCGFSRLPLIFHSRSWCYEWNSSFRT